MPIIHPTNREQRTTWRWRAELLVRRGAAFVLDPGDNAKRLTHNHVAVGQRLIDFAVHSGRAFPSHETLAARTGMSVGTVGTALALLAAAGLLAWVHTWVPNPAGFAGAKKQGPNLYSFLLPGDSGAPAYDHKPCRSATFTGQPAAAWAGGNGIRSERHKKFEVAFYRPDACQKK